MNPQYRSAYIGDSTDLSIDLAWASAAFEPGEDWALIFTAKRNSADADEYAVFQKASGAGITVSGSTATVSMVPADTIALLECSLLFDIQAQHVVSGAVRTVASGRLTIARDITRQTTTSVPVNTEEFPLPYGPPMPAGLADFTSITITAGDELELVKDGITYWLPLYRRA